MSGNGAGRPLRVALLMAVVGDLRGSGGAERHFSQLHEFLRASAAVDTVLVTSPVSLERLQAAGRLADASSVALLPLGRWEGRGKIGALWLAVSALWVTLRGGFDVVHVCLPTPTYVPYAALLSRLPSFLRPRLGLTVIDCTVAPNLRSGAAADLYERQVIDAHRMLFKWARFDGVYSWYEDFVRAARELRLLPEAAKLVAARYCFTDTRWFHPDAVKDRLVVYAGRLSAQKRPLLFVDAIDSLCRRYPALVEGWRFEMYGTGALEADVKRRIAESNFAARIVLTSALDMSPVFAKSRLFVSTQALENFTSLAMLEAMAAGNAVIAEDVGQTSMFVRHGENGFLVGEGSPDAFADAIAEYIKREDEAPRLAAASRMLATEVHTVEHFASDIKAFWQGLVR